MISKELPKPYPGETVVAYETRIKRISENLFGELLEKQYRELFMKEYNILKKGNLI